MRIDKMEFQKWGRKMNHKQLSSSLFSILTSAVAKIGHFFQVSDLCKPFKLFSAGHLWNEQKNLIENLASDFDKIENFLQNSKSYIEACIFFC